jgi:hypothetical protein
MEEELELSEYGNNLNDGESSQVDWYELIGEYGTKYLPRALGCGLSNNKSECYGEILKDICEEVGDSEVCKYADLAIDVATQTSQEPTQTQIETTKKQLKERAGAVLKEFQAIDCKDLTDTQRDKLTTALNEYEPVFREYGMELDFAEIVERLQCDVENELYCPAEEAFAPICKPNYLKDWGVPMVVGATAGGLTYYASKLKSASVVVGGVGFGITKYYLSKKESKDVG